MADVYLRPMQVEDARVSYVWRNDPEIWQYTGSRPNMVVTEEIEIAWAKRVLEDKTRANFAICTSAEDRYIGNIYLIHLHDAQGELGLFIGDKTAWGKGYGAQALDILKQIAWHDLGLQRILIDVDVNNKPAYKTYLKCGATMESDHGSAENRVNLAIVRKAQ